MGIDVIVDILQRVLDVYNNKLATDEVFKEKITIISQNVKNIDFVRDNNNAIIIQSSDEGVLGCFLRFYAEKANVDVPILFFIRDLKMIEQTKESLAKFLDIMEALLIKSIGSMKQPTKTDTNNISPADVFSMIDLPSLFASISTAFSDMSIFDVLHDQILSVKSVGDLQQLKPIVSLNVPKKDVDKAELKTLVDSIKYVVNKILVEIIPVFFQINK